MLLSTEQNKLDLAIAELKSLPQVDCKTKHYFGPGLYVREVTMPAGAAVIGKSHKTEHLCVMLQGRMRVKNENGEVVELVAPATFVGKPGKKIAYILETVVFQNIFATEETDIEKLEHMFIDTLALEGK
jgi:hypothetical protein